MANQTPLSSLSDAAGGILLPPEQGALLIEGIQRESGALQLAGDYRTTSSRREAFSIFNGRATAEVDGEGGTKPVTGAEFSGGVPEVLVSLRIWYETVRSIRLEPRPAHDRVRHIVEVDVGIDNPAPSAHQRSFRDGPSERA